MSRKRTGVASDLMGLIAKLPWWGGLVLALVSYFVLHHFAGPPVNAPVRPGQMGALAVQTMARTFANIGQYVVPLICLAGAAISAWRRRERVQLVDDVANAGSADALNGMTWQQFERLVGEGFRRQGYRVTESGGGGADGGVDLVLNRDGETFLVQCKQWRALRVGVSVVRELYGVMAAKGAAGGFVVTSGRFTAEAARFASGRHVELIDGEQLRVLIRRAQASSAPARFSGDAPAVIATAEVDLRPGPSQGTKLNCPSCSQPMVLRSARRGVNAGKSFWGCSGFPNCRGTRAVE